jgi:hypothetical protein
MNEHEHTPVDEQLEARLAAMTTWTGSVEGEGGGPLARALGTTGSDTPAVAGTIGFWRGLSKRQIAAVLVVAAGGVIVAGMVVPSQGMNRVGTSAPSMSAKPEVTGLLFEPQTPRQITVESGGVTTFSGTIDRGRSVFSMVPDAARNSDGAEGKPLLGDIPHVGDLLRADGRYVDESTRNRNYVGDRQSGDARIAGNEITQDQTTATRQIIRRAMVDVVATDVQVAFRKAQDLVKVELGEFVQESTLSGAGKAMTGRVVLRLEPSRLAEVMQAARGLGELAAEQTGGDDVTDRLTDLDAQIRNEQRVEKEMLELFDLRKDAPLKEVLDLREQLARVRGNIERMQASKSQMGRLVSLATLTLTIRPEPDVTIAPPVVEETPSFGARFSKEIGRSWDRATNNLVSSAGWAVETAIGGLPTWTVLGVTGFVIWRVVRKRTKQA